MPLSGEKFKKAEDSLPAEMRPVFRRLVQEYEFLTKVQYGRGYVAYEVLAGLIRAGWRPSAEPLPDSKL